jgi:hypothetical protein
MITHPGGSAMSTIVRYQFMGNWWIFWLLCITGIGIPVGFLYLLNGTVRIQSEVAEPEEFLAQYRTGKLAVR